MQAKVVAQAAEEKELREERRKEKAKIKLAKKASLRNAMSDVARTRKQSNDSSKQTMTVDEINEHRQLCACLQTIFYGKPEPAMLVVKMQPHYWARMWQIFAIWSKATVKSNSFKGVLVFMTLAVGLFAGMVS